jgi:dynein light intermediate chain 1
MYTTASAATDERAPEADQGLWQSMLASVASSKRVPEKNLIVLGGTAESQREMLAALSRDQRRGADPPPPVANDFALGYTYYDVVEHNKNSDGGW